MKRKTSAADRLRRHAGLGPTAVQTLHQHAPQRRAPEWYDLAIEAVGRMQRQRAAEQDAERRRQAQEQLQQMTDADAIRSAIVGCNAPGAPVPLNGVAVLRAALAGVGSDETINGR